MKSWNNLRQFFHHFFKCFVNKLSSNIVPERYHCCCIIISDSVGQLKPGKSIRMKACFGISIIITYELFHLNLTQKICIFRYLVSRFSGILLHWVQNSGLSGLDMSESFGLDLHLTQATYFHPWKASNLSRIHLITKSFPWKIVQITIFSFQKFGGEQYQGKNCS